MKNEYFQNIDNFYKIMKDEFGSRVDEYRFKWELTGKGKYIPSYPLHLNFELAFGCNLRCEFCDTTYALNIMNAKEMSVEEIAIEIRRLHIYHVTWTGGEPALQYPEIEKVIRECVCKREKTSREKFIKKYFRENSSTGGLDVSPKEAAKLRPLCIAKYKEQNQ